VSAAFDTLRSWLGAAAATPARVPRWLRIPDTAVDKPLPGGTLRPRHDYLEVRVARVHLARERQWFQQFTPLLFAAAEFSYDGQIAATPAVVGPALLRQIGADAPLSPILAGTRVAGPVPYQGGGLTLTLVLHRLAAGNVLEPFLDVLDGASKSLSFMAGLAPFTAVARVVVSGLDAVTGGTAPLVAVRDSWTTVDAGYWALIDSDGELGELSVRDRELWTGDQPLRHCDYVLCGIAAVDPVDVDVTRLPLHRQWQTVLLEATRSATPEAWQSTKVNMATLNGMLRLSPDLTVPHADALRDEWISRMVGAHDDAVRVSSLAPQRQRSPLEAVRAESLAVLDL
jgi:hypothetical protein